MIFDLINFMLNDFPIRSYLFKFIQIINFLFILSFDIFYILIVKI